MTIEEHGKNLGYIVLNFHSLEFILRAFLNRLPGAPATGSWGVSIYTNPVGTKLPVTDITNYASLRVLIARYNREVVARKLSAPIDESIVALRDALAHGRVSTEVENTPMRLIKFSPPKDGQVEVTFNEIMDEAWFKAQRRRIYDLIMSVKAAVDKLPEPKPPASPKTT